MEYLGGAIYGIVTKEITQIKLHKKSYNKMRRIQVLIRLLYRNMKGESLMGMYPLLNRIDKQLDIHTSKDALLEDLIDTYEKDVVKLAFFYVKEWNTAQDISQEVFIAVYHSIDTFEGASSYKTWIYKITANKCKDYLRTSYFKRTVFGIKQETSKTQSTEYSTESIVVEKENDSQLYNAVLTLSVKYREVIILYYYEELSSEEIAELLGISSSTVRTRLERGRRKLQQVLEEE